MRDRPLLKMKMLWCLVTVAGALSSGCFLPWEPVNTGILEVNCSTNIYHITATFASGREIVYDQAPGDKTEYYDPNYRHPKLISIVVVPSGRGAPRCSLL